MPYGFPIAAAYTVFELTGSTMMRWMFLVFSNPILFHVLPASNVLNIPSPIFKEFLGLPSPVPTQTMFGFDCCTATEPMFCVGCSSKTGVHELPLFSVFHTPPDAEPR